MSEEFFDVLSEDGSKTGERVSRTEAHRYGVLHGASHVCIYRKKDGEIEVLLQRRSLCKDSFPGCFDLSSAGHVEAGSDFLATAQKELFEELGIQAAVEELSELFDIRVSGIDNFHGEVFNNQELCRVYAYHADIDVGRVVLQESEVCGVAWFKLSYVLGEIIAGNPDFCTQREEFIRLAQMLENM